LQKDKKKSLGFTIAGLVAISVILFSFSDSADLNEGVDYVSSSTDTVIIPTVTSADVVTSVIEPTETIVKPDVKNAGVLSAGGFLFPLIQMADAVSPTQSTITIKQWALRSESFVPDGQDFAIDSSGNIYNFGSNKISRLDTSSNTLTTWEVPTINVGIQGIDVDSSGNIYFTETFFNKIARLNPSTNTFTEWDIGIAVSDLIVDSSDKVYFIQVRTGSKAGILNPSTNTLTVWTSSQLRNVDFAIDSFGNFFVTRQGQDSGIVKIDISSNTATKWLVPTINSQTLGIDVDASGTVYFTETSANKIGRLVPSTNTITEWLLPTPTNSPTRLKIDSSGSVFVGVFGGPNFLRLVPSTNTFTEWSSPVADDLIIDSSDTIYFASGNNVGTIT